MCDIYRTPGVFINKKDKQKPVCERLGRSEGKQFPENVNFSFKRSQVQFRGCGIWVRNLISEAY